MPAPRINPATRFLVATLLGLAACASNRPEQPAGAGHAAPAEATLDDYAPPAPAGVSADLQQLDASLEAYEQQLAHNESRLRAMGVRIASADPADKRESEALAKDDRFAPPPPSRSGYAAGAPARDEAAEVNTKSPAKKTKTASSSPTSRPTTTAPTAGRAQGGVSRPAEPKRAAAEEQDDDGDRGHCAELCELASATCELEAKICDLAARHTDDPRYAEVCRRADDDCRVASEACTLCSP